MLNNGLFNKIFFNKKIIGILFMLIISPFLNSNRLLAADIYIDPTYSGEKLGTFKNPYNSWNDIKSFSPNNDYRQKCGTKYFGEISIGAKGTEQNTIIIGAYHNLNGRPIHEDENPVFGEKCSNGHLKPMVYDNSYSAKLITTAKNAKQFVEINSIYLKGGLLGVNIRSDNNRVRYCYLYDLKWGIKAGVGDSISQNNILEKNYINLNTKNDEARETFDAIQLNYNASYNIVRNNHITGYDHGGIFCLGGDFNDIHNNYIFTSGANAEDFAIGHNYGGDNNRIYKNKIKNAGMAYMIMGGNYNYFFENEIYCNNSKYPGNYQGCITISGTTTSGNSNYNKIKSNIIFDLNDSKRNPGIKVQVLSGQKGSAKNNQIVKNKLEIVNDYCIRIVDFENLVDNSIIEGNICKEPTNKNYAIVEGKVYQSNSEIKTIPAPVNIKLD